MKTCKSCKESKLESQFRADRYTVDGLSYKCKTCLSAYDKQIYLTRRDKVKVSTTARRQKTLDRINEYKSSRGCNRCPENDPVCLDFHHTNDDKEFTIGENVHFKWDRIEAELIKCEILCANCHRKHHKKVALLDNSRYK